MGVSGPSLLIESTDSMIIIQTENNHSLPPNLGAVKNAIQGATLKSWECMAQG